MDLNRTHSKATGNRPFRVVISGVESTGKSTLTQSLAEYFQWPMVRESARHHPAVIAGCPKMETLDELVQWQQHAAMEAVYKAIEGQYGGIICDTGGLVLEMWGESVFGHTPQGCRELQEWFDMCVICPPNIPWEPDSLRSLPGIQDRESLHARYCLHAQQHNLPCYIMQKSAREERFFEAVQAIEMAMKKSGFSE